MEAIIKTNDNKTFQKIVKYLKTLGVSVNMTEEKKSEREQSGNFKELINKLSAGFNLGGFNREDAYDRH